MKSIGRTRSVVPTRNEDCEPPGFRVSDSQKGLRMISAVRSEVVRQLPVPRVRIQLGALQRDRGTSIVIVLTSNDQNVAVRKQGRRVVVPPHVEVGSKRPNSGGRIIYLDIIYGARMRLRPRKVTKSSRHKHSTVGQAGRRVTHWNSAQDPVAGS
jgi:hypothetical protein